jgi:hypothetical protein
MPLQHKQPPISNYLLHVHVLVLLSHGPWTLELCLNLIISFNSQLESIIVVQFFLMISHKRKSHQIIYIVYNDLPSFFKYMKPNIGYI